MSQSLVNQVCNMLLNAQHNFVQARMQLPNRRVMHTIFQAMRRSSALHFKGKFTGHVYHTSNNVVIQRLFAEQSQQACITSASIVIKEQLTTQIQSLPVDQLPETHDKQHNPAANHQNHHNHHNHHKHHKHHKHQTLAFLGAGLPDVVLSVGTCNLKPRLDPTYMVVKKQTVVKYVYHSSSHYEYTLSIERTEQDAAQDAAQDPARSTHRPQMFLCISMHMTDLVHTCEYHAVNVLQLCLQCMPPTKPPLKLVLK